MLQAYTSPEFFALSALAVAGALAIAWRLRQGRARREQSVNVILALGLLALGGPALRQAELDEHARLAAMLAGIAPTYAQELETLGHARLSSQAGPEDPLYLSLIAAERRWLGANPSVADIYTLRRRADGSVFLLVDSETDYDRDGRILGMREQRTAIGETYDEPYEALLRAFEGEASFTTEIVNDRWGSWVTAHEPLHGPDGSVEAVLGVDYPAAAWLVAGSRERRARLGWLGALALLSQTSLFVAAVLLPHLRERRRVERELSVALARAEEANQAKSQFLSLISHELRTPLNGLLTTSELLTDTRLDDEQRELLGALEHSGQALKALIDDLLDVSWLDGGLLRLRAKPFDPAEVLREVCAGPQREATARGLAFALELDPALPAGVVGDGARFGQVAGHLLSNALKFTRSGALAVALHVEERADASVKLRLEVRDTGIGFDEGKKEQLFLPFNRADATYSRRQGGAGLGLTFVRGVIEAMGGSVDCASRIGAGSTFTVRVTLPVSAEAVPRARAVEPPEVVRPAALPAPVAPTSAAGPRVLIVDDHEPNRRLLQRLLEPRGWSCVSVGDGATALAVLVEQTFQAVLLDLSMPGMDGPEVVRRLRARVDAARSTPVLAVTALEVGPMRQKLSALGIDGWIAKPVEPALLFAELARVSGGRTARAS